jgi:hypothetical protein
MGFGITMPNIMYIAVIVVATEAAAVAVVVSIAESLDSNKIRIQVFLTTFKCGREGPSATKIDCQS